MAKSAGSLFIMLSSIIIISLVVRTKCYEDHDQPTSLFIFGDSFFDSGNNNYINTTAQANYFPYGETFFKHPTGRFSDGRLVPDFIAEYAKLPYLQPYLKPGNHEFSYGVNFASAGAGALVETRQGLVIDLKTQLGYFKNVSWVLSQKLGDKNARALLSRAVYMFSVGSNDYSFPFEINSTALHYFSAPQLVGSVIGNISEVIEEIYEIGGRKFGFLILIPLGCAPYMKVFEKMKSSVCFEKLTPFLKLHNTELSKLLKKLQIEFKGFKYSLVQVYSFLEEMTYHPTKFGFKEGKMACCGSGPYRRFSSCGGRRGVKEYELFDNVRDYVCFDYPHPTERANQKIAKLAWSAKPSAVGPNNFKALFESKENFMFH